MIGSPEGNNEDDDDDVDDGAVPDRACSDVEEGKLACWDCCCD